jgi:methionine-R-sulfoxide reductase
MQGKAIAAVIGMVTLAATGCDGRTPPAAVGSAESAASQSGAAEGQAEGRLVKVKVFNKSGELVGPVEMPKVVKTDAEWQKQLTPEQYTIARGKGTEPPFCGNLLDNKKEGVYACVCCGLPLFSSDSKFHSGTGWPSFFQPVAKENVTEHVDRSYGMVRTEVLCARCGGHLGHVFDDGPRPTGLRFCVNSESLRFVESEKLATLADPAAEAGADSTATRPAARPTSTSAGADRK